MAVDEQVRQVLEYYAALAAPPLTALSPQEARRRATMLDAVNAVRQQRGEAATAEVVGDVRDEVIQGPEGKIPLRIYRPESSRLLPILLYFHGGGWVLGDLESCDATCRSLTNLAQCMVVSVAYRLAPEHPFPAAVQDAYAALQWALATAPALGADPQRLAVGGEDAGGNLAAVVAQMARDSALPVPIYQVLVYPILNYAFDTASYQEYTSVGPLSAEEMRWFWKHYLPDEAAGANVYASPLRVEEISDLPPGLMITAEYDVLRDEGEAYARRLTAAGVPMALRRSEGMVHGFLDMAPVVTEARKALLEIAGRLYTAFQPPAGEQIAGETAAEIPGAAPAPLGGGLSVRVGMEVVGSDGQRMGKVRAVRANSVVVERRFRRALVLPLQAVRVAGEQVIVNVPAKEAMSIDWSQRSRC